MKTTVKKFFLLGLGIAAAGAVAGLAYKNKDKIKKAVDDLIKKKKLSKDDGAKLAEELVAELEKRSPKPAPKKAAAKKAPAKK
ncbi:MAG: hypothetical protein HGA85_08750 [Nanoarchaeota archaeon]|nr:hypothetical protein [Nanoarchaeota archaeon]